MRGLSRLAAVLVACFFAGCDAQKALNELAQQKPPKASISVAPAESKPASTVTAPETIKICSFNIQVFGTSKLKKPQAMDVLCRVVRRFDVVAIQEVRSTDDTVVPRFVQMVNADGSKYDFVIGPRLGRTSSKEQYAVLFNTARIDVDRSAVYTSADPQDLLHREPLVAHFRVRGLLAGQGFSFNLVDIHTDPDETRTELDALADVLIGVQRNASAEDDVILLGDLNVDENHLGRLGQLPGIAHAVAGMPTNTRRDKTYDNIVFDSRATCEYTGRWGVVDLMTEYGLTEQQALEVSDHFPVWAEFSSLENRGGPLAAQPASPPR